MRLSILDQSPILSGATPTDALQESVKLAQLGEQLGFTRYWIAEHHDLEGLACSAPEVMLPYIGANTHKIRIGSGAVLLPHYKPYKVAEIYNMLATLFPDRIDLGIGRAPGASAEATLALSNNFLEGVRNMPESVEELLKFLYNDFPEGHMFSKVSASPVPIVAPETWLLGTSGKSAVLAAENGMSYAFGQFMSDQDGAGIVENYRNNFKPKEALNVPNVILAVSVICAETTEKSEELALSSHLWSIQSEQGGGNGGIPSLDEAKQFFSSKEDKKQVQANSKLVAGNPREVKQRLTDLQERYRADELMIVTITPTYEDRIRSYQLIADEML
ncbi:LLM class flavin-dependent oxidoreductase [Peribacillus glennii]|uniref:LLM class flavin-dependent oxidoreductase n=1 Tax=Peribacillus glennii TaxID=2303991 RepID=A0A372LI71_9BACI|nr:LLM class flavin-dependent oxidoreductase [Peribacillus glennii]RFU66007.1 LLM class flavin-dependent oxidoreductase [Peribacillus glennii]